MIEHFTKEDTVIVITGANDISELPYKDSNINISSMFRKFALENKHTNIVYVTQFHCHDLAWESLINKEIHKENKTLQQLNDLKTINITNFKRHFFSRHGQHLKKFGKQVLCRKITDTVLHSQFETKKLAIEAQNTIKIMEADMETLFDQYCQNPEVAFGHCISADFENEEKHMNQGVAVAFNRKFGKPSSLQYCSQNLTYQKSKFGATVYSLVTKPKYFLNAKNFSSYKETYDSAFNQLTEDFKARNLKLLICSPMGCIRDRVLPQHFVSNLLKFKKTTGASILTITKNYSPKKNLHNGMPYNVFVKYLQQIIVNKYAEQNWSKVDKTYKYNELNNLAMDEVFTKTSTPSVPNDLMENTSCVKSAQTNSPNRSNDVSLDTPSKLEQSTTPVVPGELSFANVVAQSSPSEALETTPLLHAASVSSMSTSPGGVLSESVYEQSQSLSEVQIQHTSENAGERSVNRLNSVTRPLKGKT
ncbi:hypothetical protein J6590_081852 [Homalodisca vitripennis]|nr:hypothetical protein J6590_081852 [Homalodisca vitripennis]